MFATEDEQVSMVRPMTLLVVILALQDSHAWVMAFYRATGQAHKPAPPVNTGKNTAVTKSGPGQGDSERKHGMEEFIGGDPITFDHALLFKKLQSFSLEWRLHDPYSSLVSQHETF